MHKRIPAAGMILAAALSLPGALRAQPLQSGPQAGDKVPGPFTPLNVTGPNAGEKCCQYCKNGPRPVVAVFAREATPGVIQLLKTIDAAVAANREKDLRSYVVFCSDAEGLGPQLQEVARTQGIQNVIVTQYKAGGPEKYRLSPAADVTVLVYDHFTVKANHAFKNADLTGTAIGAVAADVARMLADR